MPAPVPEVPPPPPPVAPVLPPPVALVPPEVEPPEPVVPPVAPDPVPPDPVALEEPPGALEEPLVAAEAPFEAVGELAEGAALVDVEAVVDVVDLVVVDGSAALAAADPFGTVRLGAPDVSPAVVDPPPHAATPTASAKPLVSTAKMAIGRRITEGR